MRINIRKIIHWVSLGIICGFLIGFSIALYKSINHLYIQNMLFRLVGFIFQRTLNYCVIAGINIFLILFLVLSIGNKRLRILVSCLLSFILLILGGWWLNHYLLPDKFHPKSLAINTIFILLTIFVGWIFIKAKLEVIHEITKEKYKTIWSTALCFILFHLLLNGFIIVDAYVTIPNGPNIILISIDTLRADHLGCYGYDKNTSPHIDQFSKESVLFKNARSQSHWTTPSHLSLFTSLYPSVFKVWKYPEPGRLPDSYFTLAEILKNEGYHTAAFTAGGYVHKRFGFAQGFDVYLDEVKTPNITTIFNKYSIEWIKKQKSKFMVFLHCYEPHTPYNPPEPYKQEFATLYTPLSEITKEHYWIGSERDINKKAENWFKETKNINFLNTVIGLYDGEIKYVDSEIDKLFNELKGIDLFDNCLIIFLSDHGEAFYEHNSFSHRNLYDEILRVPLIIHFPKGLQQYNMKSITDVVDLVDVLPTILDICEIPYSSYKFQGTSLLNLIAKQESFDREYSFSEHPHCKAIATLESKYKICTYREKQREEFFDIIIDPKESQNLLSLKQIPPTFQEKYDHIKNNLSDQIKLNENFIKHIASTDTSKGKIEIDDRMKKRLRSLGYTK